MRSRVVAESSLLTLKGRETRVADQVAFGKGGRAAASVVVSDGQVELVVGILTGRRVDVSATISRFLASNGMEADEPSRQRILAAIQALQLANNPGCLGAMPR